MLYPIVRLHSKLEAMQQQSIMPLLLLLFSAEGDGTEIPRYTHSYVQTSHGTKKTVGQNVQTEYLQYSYIKQ
jgi:hypothetical protein